MLTGQVQRKEMSRGRVDLQLHKVGLIYISYRSSIHLALNKKDESYLNHVGDFTHHSSRQAGTPVWETEGIKLPLWQGVSDLKPEASSLCIFPGRVTEHETLRKNYFVLKALENFKSKVVT